MWVLRIFHGLPEPHSNPSIVEAKLRIAEDLHRYTGIQSLSLIATSWDWLVLYRIIMAERLGNLGRAILMEAAGIHRRFLFSQGVALVFLLLASQSIIRIIVLLTPINDFFPSISPPSLVVITVFGAFTSFGLRIIAGNWWEEEFLLTCSLAQLPHDRAETLRVEP